MHWILILLVTMLCSILLYFQYVYSYWSRRGVPTMSSEVPWGNIKVLFLHGFQFGEMYEYLFHKLKKPGRMFAGFYAMHSPEIIILHPELAQQILITDFKHFGDRGLYCNEDGEPLTAHLLAQRADKWKTIRQKISHAFSLAKLKTLFKIMVDTNNKLQNILNTHASNQEAFDCADLSTRLTMDNIALYVLGIEVNSLDNPDCEFRRYTGKNFKLSPYLQFKVIFSLICPSLMKLLNIKKVDAGITDFFNKTIKEIVKYRLDNNIERDDFLQTLINIKHSGNDLTKFEDNWDINKIIPEVFLFCTAGYDTSASTITFFLYNMATNLDIQEKVRNEIHEVLNRYGGEITYESMNELSYLDKALNESMRMYPAIPTTRRRCTEKYRIPGTDVTIEENTIVTISIKGFGYDPEFYPDPHKFDPERFSPEEREKRPSCLHIPFGEGPRICIARRHGWVQSKAGIVAFMRNHKFTLHPKTKVPLDLVGLNLALKVKGGVWLNVEKI